MSERGWAALGDAQLDALIDRPVTAAPDLRTAQLRLREARARVDVADAGIDARREADLFDARIDLPALVFSAAIGVVFGDVPARRAARLDPIDALRHG